MDVGVTEEQVAVGDLSFDDWVEARVPALLRFAYLVTGSQHAAEDSVQSALTRAHLDRAPGLGRFSQLRGLLGAAAAPTTFAALFPVEEGDAEESSSAGRLRRV
jgi:hypothetical protein